ncbi:hypothetical protein ACFPZI_33140 [Streptomyces chlorus]|uniref:Uncharacterized protein n=1 Tax=Streptomyces chlorus TaxID=887452 RepID=A0ABW1E7M6_9ACTN
MAKSLSQHLLKVRWKQPYDSIPKVLPELRKVGDIAAPQDFIDQVAAFMAVLEIDYKDVPSHRHITDINIRRLLEPAIEDLQLEQVDVNASYRRIIERVEQANRSEGEQGQLAAYVADSSRVRYDTQILRRVASRALYRQTILDEFVYRRATVPTYTRGQTPTIAPGGAALRKKLAQGQVPSDEAAYAEELRSAWYVTWSQRRSGLAGDAMDLENLRLEVVDTVFDCRAHAQSEVIDGAAYGQRMNQLIRQRLTPEVIDTTRSSSRTRPTSSPRPGRREALAAPAPARPAELAPASTGRRATSGRPGGRCHVPCRAAPCRVDRTGLCLAGSHLVRPLPDGHNQGRPAVRDFKEQL